MDKESRSRPRRVLVVDDDPVNVEVLCCHLKDRGFEVLAASDGEKAFEFFKTEKFDLILLDLVMPGMTGFEVAKQAGSRAGAPVIILTGHADEELRKAALNIGVKDLLAKPYDFDAIDRAMAKALA